MLLLCKKPPLDIAASTLGIEVVLTLGAAHEQATVGRLRPSV